MTVDNHDDTEDTQGEDVTWLTSHELHHIRDMGTGKWGRPKMLRRAMLMGYLEGMQNRVRWYDGETRIDENRIREAIKTELRGIIK